jgi:hypothetical protein
MIRPTDVEPRDGFRIWVRYADGASGELDLSHLAGRGVFKAWENRAFFESVHLSEMGGVAWSDAIELCPDALYMRLTGQPIESLMPGARAMVADA